MKGPLSFRVATYINTHIGETSPDLLGALMVNHGEQVNIGEAGHISSPCWRLCQNRSTAAGHAS